MRLPPTAQVRIRRDKHKQAPKLSVLITTAIFTIVSSLPTNALAFESGLAASPSQKLVVEVELAQEGSEVLAAVIAIHSPITPLSAPPAVVQPRQLPLAESAVITPAPIIPAPKAAPAPQAPTPPANTALVLEGEASYYSRAGCLGCSPSLTMANGQPLNDNALTMAIGADKKHLVGRRATVTSLATGKSVEVTITDTGGFYKAKYGNRVADLTIATKQAIGMQGGVGQVRVAVH